MIKAILFDLDGVIVDSHRATIKYFQETLRHFGYPVPKPEIFAPLLGLKTLDITRALLPDATEEEIGRVWEYSKSMSLKAASQITLFPQAKETLESLRPRYKLGLVTSRGKQTVQILFAKYQLTSYFAVVVDRDDVQNHKPHPEGINLALTKLETSATSSIYVGDSKEDVETARRAGIPCVLIPRVGETFAADYQIRAITQLPELLSRVDKRDET